MVWNSDLQTRFDSLRLGEIDGTLTEAEAHELVQLIQALEAEEHSRLQPAMHHLLQEQVALRQRLAQINRDNAELAKLLSQQQQLITDARRWLTQFEQRHLMIRQTYIRVTGQELVPAYQP